MANDPLTFNTDGMREIAKQITLNANQALMDHDTAWQRMQSHLQEYPSSLQDLLFSVIDPHQKQMVKNYHWQLGFANTLSASADLVDQVEAEIAQLF